MHIVDILFGMLWTTPILIQAVGTYLANRHFRSVPIPPDTPFGLLPVSILKPLKGLDEGLEINLRSFFELDYPEFEILFSVANYQDPVLPLVQRLIKEYPCVRARLLVGERKVGLNPKINNLVRSYETALYGWILISDSNVRVDRRYLKNLVNQIDSNTGILTSVVVGIGAQDSGARLEAMYLNTFYSRGMILASLANQDCVVGKSMLFKKSSADRFGGLRALGNFLAEDYMAGEAMRHLGLKVATAWHPVPQHLGKASISHFWRRHIRWGRIRKSQAPLAFLAELMTSSVIAAMMGLFVVPLWMGVAAPIFLAMHFTIWFLLDLIVIRAVGGAIDRYTLKDWLTREFLSLPIWIHTALGNTVEWRGLNYHLGRGGVLTPIQVAS